MEQLAVILPSGIDYVYGVVNGEEVNFSLTDIDTWIAVVDKAEDGIYEILISAYNKAGTRTDYSTTIHKPVLYSFKTWTKDDYYNFEDLNKVENNIGAIAELIRLFSIVPPIETVTNRDMDTIEFAESLNRIEKNIDILATRYRPSGWQESKLDWQYDDSFSYEDANRLERNLELLYKHYRGNLDSYKYCGMINVGEEAI